MAFLKHKFNANVNTPMGFHKHIFELLGLFVFLFVASSCASTNSYEAHPATYHWEIQQLRMEVGTSDAPALAWRDLGVIYLRTGQFQKADYAFTRAVAIDRTDPKLWFYAGLSKEMQEQDVEALAWYQQVPAVSESSMYNRAIRGRQAWLKKSQIPTFEGLNTEDESALPGLSTSKEILAIRTIDCSNSLPQYANLGFGFSDILEHNLEQLNDIQVIPATQFKGVDELARKSALSPAETDSLYERSFQLTKLLSGWCSIAGNQIDMTIDVRDVHSDEAVSVEVSGRLNDITSFEKSVMNKLVDVMDIWLPNRERRMPMSFISLESLVAYSEGIKAENNNELKNSLEYLEQALVLHPTLSLASIRINEVENLILTRADGVAELVGLLNKMESKYGAGDLINARFERSRTAMNEGLIPGPGVRKLPSGNVGELPVPPRPTGN